MAKPKVKISGPGLTVLKRIRDYKIALGIFGQKATATHKDGTETIVEIMTKHEFGLDGMPERSFLRAYVEKNKKQISKLLARAADRSISLGTPLEKELHAIGVYLEGEIKAFISAGIAPPNSQKTIDAKGSDTPLIDTGQGRASISYELRKK